jgi:hypothetical protein
LLENRNSAATDPEELNKIPSSYLSKLMAASEESSPQKTDSESQAHLFQINRFTDKQNHKFTSIIKRFIPSSSQVSTLNEGQQSAR